ncbi:hypothetical protein [Micromonospora aurantiaca (nom. illeg.)]|uniref:Uncharacterized protein n=1 Tax=Micromonospora aurantiaca (nom. illeg.) TaxID=47850 RepID=A0ABQ6UGF5_9ACTN|nr:hypothetical protein [Micromonospora aurantiaca]KAB1111979.1 hypothetical protein F6X54_16015 [Micromonospora aurantiaca]
MTDLPPPPAGTPTPARRRPFLLAVAAGVAVIVIAVVAFALGRGGSDPTPRAAVATSAAAVATPSTRSAADQVECTNIDRAHNAWAGLGLPSTAADVKALNEVTVKMAMDDGDSYLDAVKGYNDQPSKDLAAAIAGYNFELSVVNAQVVIGSGVDDEQAAAVEAAVAKVADKYQAWRSARCI